MAVKTMKIHAALDAGGGRVVTMATVTSLDRFQAQPIWEMSDQTTDDHFAQATNGQPEGGAESGAQVAQNRAQQAHALNRGDSHESIKSTDTVKACAMSGESERQAAKVISGWGGIR